MSIDKLPIWLVFFATVAMVTAAVEAGYRLGLIRKSKSEDEKESPVSAAAGAVLGLSAFMLAFVFGIVADRHADRRALVREEANAIRTSWQRSDFLPESDHAEVAQLLKRYIDLRLEFADQATLDPQRIRTALDETRRIQNQLWAMAVAYGHKDNSDVTALYIESLNEVNAVHASRVALGIEARIPGEIWIVLHSITILGMVCLGYQTGIANSKRSPSWMLLAAAFSLVFALIASLDHVDSGLLKVPQQPLIDLRGEMGG